MLLLLYWLGLGLILKTSMVMGYISKYNCACLGVISTGPVSKNMPFLLLCYIDEGDTESLQFVILMLDHDTLEERKHGKVS